MEETRYSTFGDQLVKASKEIEECIIKEGTKTICSEAFWWREKLKHVTIPDSVTTIGSNAFAGCKNLTTINIPDSITKIGEYNQEIKGKTNVEIIPVSA